MCFCLLSLAFQENEQKQHKEHEKEHGHGHGGTERWQYYTATTLLAGMWFWMLLGFKEEWDVWLVRLPIFS